MSSIQIQIQGLWAALEEDRLALKAARDRETELVRDVARGELVADEVLREAFEARLGAAKAHGSSLTLLSEFVMRLRQQYPFLDNFGCSKGSCK